MPNRLYTLFIFNLLVMRPRHQNFYVTLTQFILRGRTKFCLLLKPQPHKDEIIFQEMFSFQKGNSRKCSSLKRMGGGGRQEIRGILKIHTSLKLMSSLYIKAHLVTIRAVSAIIFGLIRISKRGREHPSFQLLMSWLYDYLESVLLQKYMCKNKTKQILRFKIRKHSHALQF